MGIWATNLLHRFSDAMQLCCALEVGTFFLKILLRIAIMAILSSIPPLSNSQTSNKHFQLTRDIFKYNILSAIDSYRSHLVTRGKSIIRYVGMLRNYLKTLPSTKIVKTNFPSKNTGKGLYGYLIYLLKNDPVNIVISTSYRLLTGANRTTARRFRFRHVVMHKQGFLNLLRQNGRRGLYCFKFSFSLLFCHKLYKSKKI